MLLFRLFRQIHKVLGLLLSFLFLAWFLSGVVMIYHGFPRVNQQERIEKLSVLTALPPLDSLWQHLPAGTRANGLSVDMLLDRPVFHLRAKGAAADWYADSLHAVGKPDFNACARIAVQLAGNSIYTADTLHALDQWIPFGYLRKEFPIYKFSFQDARKQQIYVSSQTGNVLQWTDRPARIWAYLGAIPHWVYFTGLRQHQPVWFNFMVWAAGMGAVMCFTGLWIGTVILWRNRRKGLRSPYKKRWLRWHHVTGMVFGIFALTFVFSGMMSMVDLPDWMKKKSEANLPPSPRGRQGAMLAPENYVLDYRLLVDSLPGVKRIEWQAFAGHPYYAVHTADGRKNIDASLSGAVRPFCLTEAIVRKYLGQIHGKDAVYTLTLQTAGELPKGMPSLPVYKAELDDNLHTCYYFHPQTLSYKRTDDNGRLKSVLYKGLHCLDFKCLTDRPALWNILMYTLLAGGIFLSLTGVILTLQWLKRVIKSLFTRH